MARRRWSGAKLAQATKLSQNYLSKRLRDELPFTLNDVDKIARALEIDATILVLTPLTGATSSTTTTTKQ